MAALTYQTGTHEFVVLMKAGFPNLFLVGAPKSGTTTLHHYLDGHPDVFMSKNKEPRYFCAFPRDAAYHPNREGFLQNLISDETDYAALFADANGATWIGESSTDYLWVEEAAANIHAATRHCEGVRIIIVLRNPVERAFSEHSALIRDGIEDLGFLDSLDAEDERYSQRWIPLYYHRKRGLYADSVARYIKTFGPDSVGVFLFDDLVASPDAFVSDVCRFLEIDPLPADPGIKFNRSGVPRSRTLQRIERSENLIKRVIQAVTTRAFRTKLKLRIQEYNLKKIHLSPRERAVAYEIFKDDIQRTEAIIGRDLSAWML